jgi:hypothetical protein
MHSTPPQTKDTSLINGRMVTRLKRISTWRAGVRVPSTSNKTSLLIGLLAKVLEAIPHEREEIENEKPLAHTFPNCAIKNRRSASLVHPYDTDSRTLTPLRLPSIRRGERNQLSSVAEPRWNLGQPSRALGKVRINQDRLPPRPPRPRWRQELDVPLAFFPFTLRPGIAWAMIDHSLSTTS